MEAQKENALTTGEKIAASYSPFITPRDISEKLAQTIDREIMYSKQPLIALLVRCESSLVNLLNEDRNAFKPLRNEIAAILYRETVKP